MVTSPPKMPAAITGGSDKAPAAILVRSRTGTEHISAGFEPSANDITPSSPLMVTVPHSGRFYPDDMTDASKLSLKSLRASEDSYVDLLVQPIVEAGITLISATHARCYVDLNRASNELEADLFYPPLAEETLENSLRTRAGLGCIPRIVGPDTPIYSTPLPARTAEERLNAVYHPYHRTVEAHIEARKACFGMAVVVDVHSMPSMAVSNRGGRTWPDVVLGDCWGSSCNRDLTALAESKLLREGFAVRRNVPYAGGFACQHYGAPKNGVHVLQIELNRALYMNEATYKANKQFLHVQDSLHRVLDAIACQIEDRALAAE